MKDIDLVNTISAAPTFLHNFSFSLFGLVPAELQCLKISGVLSYFSSYFWTKPCKYFTLMAVDFCVQRVKLFLETFLPDADMPLSHFFFVNRQILQTNFECVLVYWLWTALLKFKKRFVKVLFQTNFMILMFHSILQLQK